MGLLERDRSLVVVIDIQGRLADTVHRADLVRAATARLIDIAGLFAVPVLVTEQYPQGLGPTDVVVQARLDALETPWRRVEKTQFGCCGVDAFDRALDELLPIEASRRQVVIAGIEAHVCVVQTVVGLLEQGSGVHVCWECVSGRGREYRDWAMARMRDEGATITNHESVAFEWARSKEHPRFRDFSRMLRESQIGGDDE